VRFVMSSIQEFAKIARDFCQWCESPTEDRSERIMISWLCKLYGAAVLLPVVGYEYGSTVDVPEDRLTLVTQNFSKFNGWFYREVFNPDPCLQEEPGLGDIGDDLLDTYKDVCNGLIEYDLGQHQEALWWWSHFHRLHWGRHVVGALRGLHCLYIDPIDSAEKL
jgi:hypothetical protein